MYIGKHKNIPKYSLFYLKHRKYTVSNSNVRYLKLSTKIDRYTVLHKYNYISNLV